MHRPRRLSVLASGGLLVMTWSAAAAGAQVMPRADSVGHASPGLFARSQAWLAAGFVGATLLAAPFDARVTRAMREPTPQSSSLLRGASRVFNDVGDPGALALGVGGLALGAVSRSPALRRMGVHVSESVVLAGVVTAAIKWVAGRERPFVNTGDTDEFHLLGGRGGARTSFPSGHTSAAFAAASVIVADVAHGNPRAARLLAPVAFSAAGLVGLARIYDNRHWLSDVTLGAGIGTFAGLAVSRLAVRHPDSALERWAHGAAAHVGIGGAGGGTFIFSLRGD